MKINYISLSSFPNNILVCFGRGEKITAYYASKASVYRLIWLLQDNHVKVNPDAYGWHISG